MKYVSVRHKSQDTRVWWFSVPASLENNIYVGADVLCNTRVGSSPGKIVSILDGVEQGDAEKIIGNYFPLKSILAVAVSLDMDSIHIPFEYTTTCPKPWKIKKRIEEFYDTGKFDTPIIFAPDGTLRDGYSAYLVAKMFDHDVLKGFCTSD